MRCLRSIGTVLLFILWAGSAHAVSLGANGGFSVLMPKGGGDAVTQIGVPSGSGLFGLSLQPGLRVGSTSASGNDAYVDLSLAALVASGSNFTSFHGTLNYQHTFSPDAGSSPFVNVGAGAILLGGDGETLTNVTLGGGVGARSRVSSGHGVMRGEFRLDYITEDSQGFVGGVVLGVKLGFDLLIR